MLLNIGEFFFRLDI